MSKVEGRISMKSLTAILRDMADEVIDIDAEGKPITREAALAALIWKQANGWVEKTRDDDGNEKEIPHKPLAWAQQFLWERLEGKAPQAQPEVPDGLKATDKIGVLVADRLNAIAKARIAGGAPAAVSGNPPRKGPPKFTPKPQRGDAADGVQAGTAGRPVAVSEPGRHADVGAGVGSDH